MTEAASRLLDARVPPPVIYVVAFGFGLGVEALLPTPAPPLPVSLVVGLLGVAAWVALDPGAMREFSRAGTEVSPSRPASALVTDGPYRRTRNPMYVGMAALHGGLAIAFGVAWALLTLGIALVLIDRVVVRREERYLAQRFGAEYERYRSSVRRWL